MFLLVSRLPPTVAGIGLLLAHLAVFVDIALRRDLSWWGRIVDGVLVGLLLPLGALGYLLVRPIGLRMRRRVDRRQAAGEQFTGWRRSTAA